LDSEGREAPNPKLWKKIVIHLVGDLEEKEDNKLKIATDYSKALYSVKLLDLGKSNGGDIQIPASQLQDDSERSDEIFYVKVKQSATIATDQARNVIQNLRAACVDGKELPGHLTDVERVLNVALKTQSSRNFISVGRSSFFSPPTQPDLGFRMGGGVVNLTGFSLIYTMGWKNFINVDTANSVFVMGSTVNELLKDLGIRFPYDVAAWTDREFQMASDLLKSVKVSYMTGTGKHCARPVRELKRRPARECTFEDENKKPTNVELYYKETQKRTLQYPKGACLLLGKTAVVPAEVNFEVNFQKNVEFGNKYLHIICLIFYSFVSSPPGKATQKS